MAGQRKHLHKARCVGCFKLHLDISDSKCVIRTRRSKEVEQEYYTLSRRCRVNFTSAAGLNHNRVCSGISQHHSSPDITPLYRKLTPNCTEGDLYYLTFLISV